MRCDAVVIKKSPRVLVRSSKRLARGNESSGKPPVYPPVPHCRGQGELPAASLGVRRPPTGLRPESWRRAACLGIGQRRAGSDRMRRLPIHSSPDYRVAVWPGRRPTRKYRIRACEQAVTGSSSGEVQPAISSTRSSHRAGPRGGLLEQKGRRQACGCFRGRAATSVSCESVAYRLADADWIYAQSDSGRTIFRVSVTTAASSPSQSFPPAAFRQTASVVLPATGPRSSAASPTRKPAPG
jgi:hypothetical protein